MRKILLLILIVIGNLASLTVVAQNNFQYVVIKTGLSIREKPDVNAKVIEKIPYATKIDVLPGDPDMKMIITEGVTGFWRKAKYNNKTGYIIDSYLFPYPPPKASVKTLKDYFGQIATVFGGKLVVKSGTMNNIEEGGHQVTKQLYKNGAEWHEFQGYEYGSMTYFIPDLNMQQAFLLLRMIPEFAEVIGTKDEFPSASKTIKRGEIEYEIKVDSEMIGDSPWIKKISIGFGDGAVYMFELYQIDNQIVVFYGSGV